MCTNFKVLSKHENLQAANVIIGRSMEYGVFLDSKLFFRKAGHEFKQCLFNPFTGRNEPEQSKTYGLSWTGIYNFVSMSAFNQPIATDGINSEGLYIGEMVLNCTEYQTVTEPEIGLSFLNFPNWVLSNFATCEEVKAALLEGKVQIGKPFDEPMGMHFPVHDAGGKSIVIELIAGEISVHDNNHIGVLTNDPPFPWQVTNLENYLAINPVSVTESYPGNISPAIEFEGQGSGFYGIPGSSIPADRFVKAAMMVNYSLLTNKNGLENGANLAYHILNTVDIPYGIIRTSETGMAHNDYTLFITVSDLTKRIFSVRQYQSPLVFSIDLSKIDFDKLDESKQYIIPTEEKSIDLTSKIVDNDLDFLVIDEEVTA